MAKLKRPVRQTYLASDVEKGRDPYAGKAYSRLNPDGAPRPTHPMRKVPGTGRAQWDSQLERWTV